MSARPSGSRRTPHTARGMAPRTPLRPLRLLLLHTDLAQSRAMTQGPRTSCADTLAPPCAPCERAAPLPCRAEPLRTRPALRVTCCARRPHAPPPCFPEEQRFTCLHARPAGEENKQKSPECSPGRVEAEPPHCGAELDRVAQRLAAAKNVRRKHYECEASAIASAPRDSVEVAPAYRLLPERECVRATDGSDYTLMAGERAQDKCPRCGPDCRTSAPRAVDLAPSDNCEPHRGSKLDPCAHHPRVLLRIDRDPSEESSQRTFRVAPLSSANEPSARRKSPNERLTTRIVESLNFRGENKISCSKSNCPSRDDTLGWCVNLPKPTAAAPRCREPSVVEQLRRRPGVSIRSCGKSLQGERYLHTSTVAQTRQKVPAAPACASSASTMPDEKKKKTGGLEVVIRERSQLKEVARGRVMRPQGAAGRLPSADGGQLELRVPPASEAVRVRVSLDFLPSQSEKLAGSVPTVADCKNSKFTPARSLSSRTEDSWLSIKGIQRKLSDYCKNEKSSSDATRNGSPCSRPGSGRPTTGEPGYGSRCPPRKPTCCTSAPQLPQILY